MPLKFDSLRKLYLQDYAAEGLLQETLNEEAIADQALSRLAERKLNFEAMTT